MSVHEELFLNPFEKWSRYGRFPGLFFLHAALVVLVTSQVMFYLNRDITHACHTASHLSMLLLKAPHGSVTYWRPGDLQDALENAIHNIFLVNDVTFNDIKYIKHSVDLETFNAEDHREEQSLPVVLRFRNTSDQTVVLSRTSFAQAHQQVAEYLQQNLPVLYTRDVPELEEIFVEITLLETVHQVPVKGHFLWNLVLRFDGTNVGRFVGSLGYRLETTGRGFQGWRHLNTNVAIILLSSLCLFLLVKRVRKSTIVMCRLRRAAARAASMDEASVAAVLRLDWWDEMALYNWWWAVSTLGHVTQLASTAVCLRRTQDVISRFGLLGWSCCLTWMNICQYLEFFPGYYVTFSTTGKGMASVCRYMASVLPILTAFMFLGTCHFWQAGTFQGITASYASLFSLLNGDMVHDAFVDLWNVGGWAGHVYLYVFIFVFIYIILNVNITIIEEAYFSARLQGLKHQEQVESAKQLQTPLDFLHFATEDEEGEEPKPAVAVVPQDLGTPLLRKESHLLTRGSVSPRILNHPRLQAALIAGNASSSASRAAAATQALYSSSSASAITENSGFRASSEQKAAPGLELPHSAGAALSGTNHGHWWLTEFPRLTLLLRATPLPCRSEFDRLRENGWEELQRLVAKHQEAVSEVSSALHGELSQR